MRVPAIETNLGDFFPLAGSECRKPEPGLLRRPTVDAEAGSLWDPALPEVTQFFYYFRDIISLPALPEVRGDTIFYYFRDIISLPALPEVRGDTIFYYFRDIISSFELLSYIGHNIYGDTVYF